MLRSVDEALMLGEECLRKSGFAEEQIRKHVREWEHVAEYAKVRGEDAVTSELVSGYVESNIMARGLSDAQRRVRITRVQRLLECSKTGCIMLGRKKAPARRPPDKFKEYHDSFVEEMVRRELSEKSREKNDYFITCFMMFMEDRLDRLEQMGEADLVCYLMELEGLSQASRNQVRTALRILIRALVRDFGLSPALLESRCLKQAPAPASLPSFYSPEEVALVLKASYRGNFPRRSRLIVSLCVQYGIRIGDVAKIKLSDFRWAEGSIVIEQSKTGVCHTLPLSDEIRLCVLDYLKNERPETDSPYLFVKMTAPGKGEGPVVSLKGVVREAFKASGVNTVGRKAGPHALRHTFATTLLNENVSYYVIAHSLGQTSVNVTREYLDIDIEKLRTMSLEVPPYGA